jgi:heptosyltransferase-1
VSRLRFAVAGAEGAPRSILVVKPSSLGDIVHTLPAVALVRQHWPAARMRWLINSEWASLLEGNPDVDEVLDFPRSTFRGPGAAVAAARWAVGLRPRAASDLVLDFQGLLRSALLARLCRGKGGRIAGLSDAREGARLFYDHTADVSGRLHAVERYLALVASLGIDNPGPLAWPLPGGVPPAAELPARFVLLHPFSRGAGKSLAPEEVAAFCRALAPFPVLIAGRSAQTISAEPNAVDLLNRSTLPELIWLIRHAAFVVSVDSGPMHIAAALTDRLLSLHTWSDPRRVGPYRKTAWVWKDGRLGQVRDLAEPQKSLPAPDLQAVAGWLARRLRED